MNFKKNFTCEGLADDDTNSNFTFVDETWWWDQQENIWENEKCKSTTIATIAFDIIEEEWRWGKKAKEEKFFYRSEKMNVVGVSLKSWYVCEKGEQ